MVFKRFSVLVSIRVALMLVNMALIARYLSMPNKTFTLITLSLMLIIQIYELLFFINKTNRSLSYFLDILKDKDYSVVKDIEIVDSSFKSLNQSFKNIARAISESKLEKEAQFHLLNLIIDKVETGILLMDKQKHITLINQSAERDLKITQYGNYLNIMEQIPEIESLLYPNLSSKKVIEVYINNKKQEFLVYSTPVTLLNKNYTLLTFSNIQDELDKKEIQSWQKLLRTLSHEIMNSVTPITSLTETSLTQIQSSEGKLKDISELNPAALAKVQKALITIEKRSSGLFNFVNDFRKLAKIPEPVKKTFLVKDLFESAFQLMNPEMEKSAIEFSYHILDKSMKINADSALIEQVLINLIMNAKDAVSNVSKPMIKLKAKTEKNKRLIEVKDNGAGISEELQKEIFIPFFTTKENLPDGKAGGSGIGLSLSRQIMHLHGGNISVKSEPNVETVFTLTF